MHFDFISLKQEVNRWTVEASKIEGVSPSGASSITRICFLGASNPTPLQQIHMTELRNEVDNKGKEPFPLLTTPFRASVMFICCEGCQMEA